MATTADAPDKFTAPSARYKTTQKVLQGILAFVFLAAGAANLMGAMDADLARLGFPEYFSLIIGVAYLISVVCIYQTRFPFLQDWAFAGMAVSLVGAAGSHILAGDPIGNAMPAIIIQIVLVFAYVMRAKLALAKD